MEKEIQFEVISKLGKRIRATKEYWENIVNIKHPSMKDREEEVKIALQEPDEVKTSNTDKSVFLYYKKINNYWTCVVARHLDGDGFVITTYLTDAQKVGETVWKK